MNIVVVFPGQGSQSIGMLADYAEVWPQIEETFKQASDVLGYDCWDIVCNGPVEKINKTEITQPLMLAADIAVMRVMEQQCMLTPMVFAGHSLGEYAALVAAGSLDYIRCHYDNVKYSVVRKFSGNQKGEYNANEPY